MVSISFTWDDGAEEDIRLAELSNKFNIPGIFFIPHHNAERPVITSYKILDLFKENFEIGAHTYSHQYLTKINPQDIKEELQRGKSFLEDIINDEIKHFCLPGGFYNKSILKLSKCYFKTVRTADTCYIGQSTSLIKPTFHFYNRGFNSLAYNSIKKESFIIFKYLLLSKYKNNYFELVKDVLTRLNYNPTVDAKIIFWGHSWEIEQYSLWDKLEDLFCYLHENYPASVLSYSDFIKKQIVS